MNTYWIRCWQLYYIFSISCPFFHKAETATYIPEKKNKLRYIACLPHNTNWAERWEGVRFIKSVTRQWGMVEEAYHWTIYFKGFMCGVTRYTNYSEITIRSLVFKAKVNRGAEIKWYHFRIHEWANTQSWLVSRYHVISPDINEPIGIAQPTP